MPLTSQQPIKQKTSGASLFIYFCCFLVLEIYDRTFATLLRLFTQADTSAEKMILVMKGLGLFSLWHCGTGLWSSAMTLQVPERGWGFGWYCFVVGWRAWLMNIWCSQRVSRQECRCDQECVTKRMLQLHSQGRSQAAFASVQRSHPLHAYHLV